MAAGRMYMAPLQLENCKVSPPGPPSVLCRLPLASSSRQGPALIEQQHLSLKLKSAVLVLHVSAHTHGSSALGPPAAPLGGQLVQQLHAGPAANLSPAVNGGGALHGAALSYTTSWCSYWSPSALGWHVESSQHHLRRRRAALAAAAPEDNPAPPNMAFSATDPGVIIMHDAGAPRRARSSRCSSASRRPACGRCSSATRRPACARRRCCGSTH